MELSVNNQDDIRKFCIEMINVFISSIFDGKSLDFLLESWSRISLSENTIESNEKLYSSIINSPIELIITTTYIELFKQEIHLRIPIEILSDKTKEFITIVRQEKYWKYFFKKRLFEGEFSQNIILTNCLFNDIVTKNINRYHLVGSLIYQLLVEAICHDENHDIFRICLQSTVACLKNMNTSKKRKSRHN